MPQLLNFIQVKRLTPAPAVIFMVRAVDFIVLSMFSILIILLTLQRGCVLRFVDVTLTLLMPFSPIWTVGQYSSVLMCRQASYLQTQVSNEWRSAVVIQ